MRIALGADHHGVTLKARIKEALEAGRRGDAAHTCVDFGAHAGGPVDYPDVARPVAEGVGSGAFERGILICSNGIGMSIAANMVPGVRAALVHCLDDAHQCREHNDANVVTLAGRRLDPELALDIVTAFLQTPFAGGRHERRVAKLTELDRLVEENG